MGRAFGQVSHLLIVCLSPLLTTPLICRRLHTLIGHRGEISNALFSYDSTIIATASMDKTCKIWDSRTGTVIETLRCVSARFEESLAWLQEFVSTGPSPEWCVCMWCCVYVRGVLVRVCGACDSRLSPQGP